MSVICAVCMNFVWRTVCISVLSGLTSLTILVISIVYNAHVHGIISQVLESRQCWKYNALGELNWTLILNNTENSCVFIFLQPLYPGAVIAWTGTHILSDIFLSIGAIYRSNIVLLIYLALDAAHLGVLASFWSLAFLTERMPRMVLMIITFPLISFGLCAWMTVFGFYLKLEESAWVKIRRKKKKEKLEKILTSDWMKSHSKDDLTESMYDLCSGSMQQNSGKLPKHKNLEEILKQELAWTLEQIGEEDEGEENAAHELATFTNEAFSLEDNDK